MGSTLRLMGAGALAACALVVGGRAEAGNYNGGVIQQIVVGRLQDQVFFQVSGGSQIDWPCSSTRTDGLNFSFSLSRPDAEELLSTLMTAYATNSTITVVGTGGCGMDPAMEDVSYLWLKK